MPGRSSGLPITTAEEVFGSRFHCPQWNRDPIVFRLLRRQPDHTLKYMHPYESTQAPPTSIDETSEQPLLKSSRPVMFLLMIIVAINGALLMMANEDRSWGAFGIALLVGPIANGVIMLLALVCAPGIRRSTGGPILIYVLTAIFIPFLATVCLFLFIGMMPLHGC